MIYDVEVNDKKYKLEIINSNKKLEIKIDGRNVRLDNYITSAGRLTMLLKDNCPYEFEIFKDDSAYDCWLGSKEARCAVISEKEARYAKLMGSNISVEKAQTLKAPMPGLVVNIHAQTGRQVKKGDPLMVVEAMKMENELKASQSGTVKEIKVTTGQPVEKNQVLVVFE